MENMNRPITSTEIESVIKNSTNKSPGQVGFTTEFYQTFRKELILWNYSKNLLRQEHFETHSINLIEKLDKGAQQNELYRPTLLSTDRKILNKTLANFCSLTIH